MKTTIDHAGRLVIPKDIRRGTCAERGKASTVLTFNAGDFAALGKDFAVVIPGSV